MERTRRLVLFLLPVNDGCLKALSWTRHLLGKDTISPEAFLYSDLCIIVLATGILGPLDLYSLLSSGVCFQSLHLPPQCCGSYLSCSTAKQNTFNLP